MCCKVEEMAGSMDDGSEDGSGEDGGHRTDAKERVGSSGVAGGADVREARRESRWRCSVDRGANDSYDGAVEALTVRLGVDSVDKVGGGGKEECVRLMVDGAADRAGAGASIATRFPGIHMLVAPHDSRESTCSWRPL